MITKTIKDMTTTSPTTTFEILTGVQAVHDYPYGSLKCTMSFSVEFQPKKGYRAVTQSINPKTKRENKPKKSTYSDFMFMYKDAESGHIKFRHHSIKGFEDVTKIINLFAENDIQLSEAESQHLWLQVLSAIKISTRFSVLKEGVTTAQFLDATKVSAMIKLYGGKAPFAEIVNVGYDFDTFDQLIDHTKSVFTFTQTTYSII